MCGKANNIPCQYAWRQSRFRENIPYGAPSAALCVESNIFTAEEYEWVTCVLAYTEALNTKYPAGLLKSLLAMCSTQRIGG